MSSRYFSKRIPERTAVRRKRNRPKTFKTKEKAEHYAKEKNIPKYKITQMNKNKFRVDVE